MTSAPGSLNPVLNSCVGLWRLSSTLAWCWVEYHSYGRPPALYRCQTSNPKDLSSYRMVALTFHLMKTLERLILQHCRPLVRPLMDPLQFGYQPNRGGWRLHLSTQSSFSSGEAWEHCEDHVLWFLQCFQHHSTGTSDGQTRSAPHILDIGLPDQQTPVCEDPGLCVGHGCLQYGGPSRTGPCSILLHPLQCRLHLHSPSCHLQKFSDDSAIVGLSTDEDDREYRGLMQDFVDWCQRNCLQINAGKTKELVVDFCRCRHPPDTAEHPGKGHRVSDLI